MEKYRFYRTYEDGWRNHRPLKTWDHPPTVSEVSEELNKLSQKILHGKPPYVRFWVRDHEEGAYTVFDFGSWETMGIVFPDISERYLSELRGDLH